MLYVIVIQVTKHDRGMLYIIATVTQLCDTEKNIEGSRINDVI